MFSKLIISCQLFVRIIQFPYTNPAELSFEYRIDTHKAEPAKSAVNSLQQNIASFGVIRILSSRITVCELSAVSTHLLMEEEVNDVRFTIKGF